MITQGSRTQHDQASRLPGGYKSPAPEAVLNRDQHFAMTNLTLKMGQYRRPASNQ
jgi:hypothetical protein